MATDVFWENLSFYSWNSNTSTDASTMVTINYYYNYSTSTSTTATVRGITYLCESPPKTEEQKRAEEIAKQKADELLKAHIGVEAFGKLHEIGHIELDSQKYKGRKYRIPENARNLIEIIENDKVIDKLCIHPRERYQDSDEILTRLTLLQYAEEYLLKLANHNPVRI